MATLLIDPSQYRLNFDTIIFWFVVDFFDNFWVFSTLCIKCK